MSLSRLPALGLGISLLFSVFILASSAQTTSSKSTPNAVKGTVSLKGKGVGGVLVIARPTNSDPQRRPTYRGVTDQEGNYRITNIPPGTFQIGPAAPEY